MLQIRKVNKNEVPMIRFFYEHLIDEWRESPYPMGWVKGIFPSEEYLLTSVEKGALYLGIEDNRCIAAMIVDRHMDKEYKEHDWPHDVADDKVMVLHALGVAKPYIGRGYGNMMLEKALTIAKENHCVVMRSAAWEDNYLIEQLYNTVGFVCVGEMSKYFEEKGETIFKLYEYTIKQEEYE